MTVTYLLSDHLGSTSLSTDAAGAVLAETKYKACPSRVLREGEVRFTTPNSTLPTRYTFTGQYSYVSDDATDLGAAGFGLMYYNARWYDPYLSRFAQADTIVPGAGDSQAWDRYAYGLNNPVRYSDPSGHRPVILDDENKPVVDMDWKRPNLSKKYVERRFMWKLSGEWTSGELEMIYRAGYDIEMYVNSITEGKGLAWMQKYLGGTNFVHGGLFGAYNYVTGETIHLLEGGFNEKTVVHELGHIWDNHSAVEAGKPIEAVWLGGGNADLMHYFLGGGIPSGLRWTNGQGRFIGLGGIEGVFRWPDTDYSNHSTADYFAEAFKHSVYSSGDIPSNSWGYSAGTIINAFIVVDVSSIK